MSKRIHLINARYTDEEFDAINREVQRQLAAVAEKVGLHFTRSSIIRNFTLTGAEMQAKQRQTLYHRRCA